MFFNRYILRCATQSCGINVPLQDWSPIAIVPATAINLRVWSAYNSFDCQSSILCVFLLCGLFFFVSLLCLVFISRPNMIYKAAIAGCSIKLSIKFSFAAFKTHRILRLNGNFFQNLFFMKMCHKSRISFKLWNL